MMKVEFDESMSKAQIIERAQNLDARRQAQIARQIDQINRLLGHEFDESGETLNGDIPVYQHELMTLNEKLATYDVLKELQGSVIRRMRQSLRDRLRGSSGDKPFLGKMLAMLDEGFPDERSGDVDAGRATDDVQITDVWAKSGLGPKDD